MAYDAKYIVNLPAQVIGHNNLTFVSVLHIVCREAQIELSVTEIDVITFCLHNYNNILQDRR